jgi:K+/H+ antiporter YhaU regulatory subunit KhtT
MQFIEVLRFIKEKYNAIIVGIESGEDNKLVANPPVDYTIQPGDDLILIAHERPHLGK